MTASRVVRKSLAGQEDLLLGKGIVVQSRNGVDYDITKLAIIAPVASEAELLALDTTQYLYAILGGMYYSWSGTAWLSQSSTVINIAALKASDLVVGQLITTLDYSVSGEGGGADYVIIASGTPDEFGDHSITSGGVARLQRSGQLNAKQFGVLPSNPDNAAALTAAIVAANGGSVYIPAGTYPFTSTMALTTYQVDLVGDSATVLDGITLHIKKPITTLPALVNDVSQADIEFEFVSAHGLAQDDVFVLYNPTDYSFQSARTYYRDGCMFRVSSIISSTEVRVYDMAPSAFVALDIEVYQLNGGPVSIEGLTIKPPATGIPLWIAGHQRVTLTNVTAQLGAIDTSIELLHCFDIAVEGIAGAAELGSSYPIVFANSQNIVINAMRSNSTTHCLAFGGRDEPGSVPCREIRVTNSVLLNDGKLGFGAADVHGNVADLVYSGCYITHANMAGRNNAYLNCTIVGRPLELSSDGAAVWGTELQGGLFRVEGCHLVTTGDLSSFGAIYLSVADIADDTIISVKNNTLVCANATVNGKALSVNVGSTGSPFAHQLDVLLERMKIKAASFSGALVVLGTDDVSGNASYIVDDIVAPAATSLVLFSNTANNVAPMKLQTQITKESVNTPNGGFEADAAAWVFRYPYPRAPLVQATAGSATGSSQSGLSGGRVVVPWVRAYSAAGATLSILSGDGANFTSAVAVGLMGRAEINEL